MQSGDSGSIPARGTKTPHVVGQLSPCTATSKVQSSRARARQQETPHDNEDPARCNYDPTQPKTISKLKTKDSYSQPLTCFFTPLGFNESAQRPSPPREPQYVPMRDTPLCSRRSFKAPNAGCGFRTQQGVPLNVKPGSEQTSHS